jgi:nifR3 family TIM-barrel protein
MKNIWTSLPKPFFVLAPMEDVTDTVFRRIIAKCGKPELYFTEFTSVDAIHSKGQQRVMHRFQHTEIERPLIAQIWGMKPENYFKTAQMLQGMHFDGIDINMGCPVPAVVARGACSALINNRPLVAEIIAATRKGAGELPLSVKVRIGFKTIETEDWISFLLDQNLDAITIHGRTTREQSKVPAHWDEIAKAVKVRDQKGSPTIIVGNGDIQSRVEGLKRVQESGVDGVMVGRGIFTDPWIFNSKKTVHDATVQEKLELLQEHITLFQEVWGDSKNHHLLKKFYKIYINGFHEASALRQQLVQLDSLEQTVEILQEYIKQKVPLLHTV